MRLVGRWLKARKLGLWLVPGAVGLLLLAVALCRLLYVQPGVSSVTRTAMRRPLPRRATPSMRALWEAQQWRLQAFLAADDGRKAEEASDPDPIPGGDREAGRRRRLIVRDDRGYLARARSAARQALTLARTPTELIRATALLARLECNAGHHAAELEQARRLVALAPRKPLAWMALRRAARCNGLEALTKQADTKMEALAEPVAGRSPPSELRREREGREPSGPGDEDLGPDVW
jgi:hypothetical protein